MKNVIPNEDYEDIILNEEFFCRTFCELGIVQNMYKNNKEKLDNLQMSTQQKKMLRRVNSRIKMNFIKSHGI